MVMFSEKQLGRGLKEICEHRFALAADLGQSQDYTAIAIIEQIKVFHVRSSGKEQQKGQRFEVRHLQRLPLGLSYVDQASRVADLLARPPLARECLFCVDESGVGRPVADIFDKAGLQPTRITITGGDKQTCQGTRRFHVPKAILISGLDARLHTGELKIAPDLAEAKALRDELADFRRHVSFAGRPSFEARSGKHDDLVLAVAIGLWAFIGRPMPAPGFSMKASFIPKERV